MSKETFQTSEEASVDCRHKEPRYEIFTSQSRESSALLTTEEALEIAWWILNKERPDLHW